MAAKKFFIMGDEGGDLSGSYAYEGLEALQDEIDTEDDYRKIVYELVPRYKVTVPLKASLVPINKKKGKK